MKNRMLILIFCVLAILSGLGLSIGDRSTNPYLMWGVLSIAVLALLYLLLSAVSALATRAMTDTYDSFHGLTEKTSRENAASKRSEHNPDSK